LGGFPCESLIGRELGIFLACYSSCASAGLHECFETFLLQGLKHFCFIFQLTPKRMLARPCSSRRRRRNTGRWCCGPRRGGASPTFSNVRRCNAAAPSYFLLLFLILLLFASVFYSFLARWYFIVAPFNISSVRAFYRIIRAIKKVCELIWNSRPSLFWFT
jgi:hypothetical protein